MRRGLGTSVLLVEAALLVCLGAFVNVLHADPAPRCEGCDKEWGDVGLNALCRAGMPSTACAQARSEANMVQEGAGGELGAGSLSSPGAQSPPAISPYRVAPGSARYSIAVPGHWEVLSSVTLKVIIHASGPPLPLTSVFQLLIEGRKHVEDNLGEDPGKQHVSPDKWVDGRIWQLADMGESQQPGAVSESFSYVFVFDVSNAADGPLEISLLFHPGEDAEEEGDAGEEGGGEVEERERDRRRSSMIRGSHPAVRPHVIRHEESELHGWVLVEQIEVLLAGHASLAASGGEVEEGGGGESKEAEGGGDADVGCVREVGLDACRGCSVLGVAQGVVSHSCSTEALGQAGGKGEGEGEGQEGGGRDELLQDDERRSQRFARAALAIGALPPRLLRLLPPTNHSTHLEQQHASARLFEEPGSWEGGGGGSWAEFVTVTVTSCGRLALLAQTLESFFAANDYAYIHKVIILDDSGSPSVCHQLKVVCHVCVCVCIKGHVSRVPPPYPCLRTRLTEDMR
jgi:hypothetical protein